MDGISHLLSRPALWKALLLGVVPTLFVLGPVQSVLPKVISNEFPGAEIFRGLVFVALGLGTHVGAQNSLLLLASSGILVGFLLLPLQIGKQATEPE